MQLRIFADEKLEEERFISLCDFLCRFGLAPQGGSFFLEGDMADQELPQHPSFRRSSEPGGDLEICFLQGEPIHDAAYFKHGPVAKFLVGTKGLPDRLDHVCVPFQGKKARKWLPPVLLEGSRLGWKVRLIHLERGIVPHEIVKLADWFHLDGVKEALKSWLTEEMASAFQDYLDQHPETEIQTSVGPVDRFFRRENAHATLIMGRLTSGYHLPNRHHGLNYAALLTRTGACGYFPAAP